MHWSFELPSLASRKGLQRLGATLREVDAKVVFLDPLFLCLLVGKGNASASNLYDIGPILAAATKTCVEAGATPIFVHHATKKSSQKDSAQPLELDDLSFAGIGEYVRQWMLVSRRSIYQTGTGTHHLTINVGGSVGHSSCWNVDISEGKLRDDFTGRAWEVNVTSSSASTSTPKPNSTAKSKRHTGIQILGID